MGFTVAIIGRPNVGKSTLFNRLAGQKLALVDDTPGVTRDRRMHAARLYDLKFDVIDTAGLEEAGPATLEGRMRAQTETAMDEADLARIRHAFRDAAKRALAAGFEVVELHGAHGYLLHSFLSPLTNRRNDAYGGDLEGRMKLPLEVARIVRESWPENLPVWYRVSAQDGVEGGLELADTIELVKRLKAHGIDLVDCSSGGIAGSPSLATVHPGPGFQVPFADAIRKGADIATMAVGFITEAEQAEAILAEGKADMIAIAREHLADPVWAYRAALALGAPEAHGLLPHLYHWYLERRARLQRS